MKAPSRLKLQQSPVAGQEPDKGPHAALQPDEGLLRVRVLQASTKADQSLLPLLFICSPLGEPKELLNLGFPKEHSCTLASDFFRGVFPQQPLAD